MTFKLAITRQAQQQADNIFCWLEDRSKQGAAAWRREWLRAGQRLKDFADGCGLAPEDEFADETIRQVLFRTRRGRTYRALFVIRENVVYVFAVRGPGQDILHPDEIELPEDD